jgi:hypothetical protein
MTRTLRAGFFAALVGISSAAGCGGDDDGGTAPRIDSLAPSSAAPGAQIDVLGVRFCGPAASDVGADDACTTPPAGFVTFGTTEGVRGTVNAWKGTRITVTVPAALEAGVTNVVVTVNGVVSNARDFNVVD